MKKFFFAIIFLIHYLFANTYHELDLHTIEDLGLDSSFLEEPSLKKMYEKYATKGNIKAYDDLLKKSILNINIVRDRIDKDNLPNAMLFVPLVESSFRNQKNKKGSTGLWQFLPKTAQGLNLKNDKYVDERLDLLKATEAATFYLRSYYEKFDKWYLAILSYNAGQGRIISGLARSSLDKYLEENPEKNEDKKIKLYKQYIKQYLSHKIGMSNLFTIYKDLGVKENYFDLSYTLKHNSTKDYLPTITVRYIHKIVVYSMIANRNLLSSLYKKNEYKLEKISIDKSLRLRNIASALDIDYKEFMEINKHFKNDLLPKNTKPYNIYIPSNKLSLFYNIKNKIQLSDIITHTVKQGDTLTSISKKYDTSVNKILKDTNKKTSSLKIGEKLEFYK